MTDTTIVKLIARCYGCGYTQPYKPFPPGTTVCGHIICPHCNKPMSDTQDYA